MRVGGRAGAREAARATEALLPATTTIVPTALPRALPLPNSLFYVNPASVFPCPPILALLALPQRAHALQRQGPRQHSSSHRGGAVQHGPAGGHKGVGWVVQVLQCSPQPRQYSQPTTRSRVGGGGEDPSEAQCKALGNQQPSCADFLFKTWHPALPFTYAASPCLTFPAAAVGQRVPGGSGPGAAPAADRPGAAPHGRAGGLRLGAGLGQCWVWYLGFYSGLSLRASGSASAGLLPLHT